MEYKYATLMQFLTAPLEHGSLDLSKANARASITHEMGQAVSKIPEMMESLPGEKHEWEVVSHSISFHVNTAVLSLLLRYPA